MNRKTIFGLGMVAGAMVFVTLDAFNIYHTSQIGILIGLIGGMAIVAWGIFS